MTEKEIDDKVNKITDVLTEYEQALVYAQLNRKGMTLERAAAILKKRT